MQTTGLHANLFRFSSNGKILHSPLLIPFFPWYVKTASPEPEIPAEATIFATFSLPVPDQQLLDHIYPSGFTS